MVAKQEQEGNGGGGGEGMTSELEAEMHQKWNVAFKKEEQARDQGELDERRQRHLAKMEEEEVRRLAHEAMLRREERERAERERATTTSDAGVGPVTDERTRFILSLLEESKGKIPDSVKIAFTPDLVHLSFDYSAYNKMRVKATFPRGFCTQNRILHCEVASKTLHQDLVEKLESSLDTELARTFGKAEAEAGPGAGTGNGEKEGEGFANPVTHVYAFCDKFLGKNHLLTAYGEIQKIKKDVLRLPSKLLGLDNKHGAIKVHLEVEKYFMDAKVRVYCKNSLDYPDGNVEIALLESNLPEDLAKSFLALTEARIRLHGNAAELPDAEILEDKPPEKEVKSKMKKKVHPRKVQFQSFASAKAEQEMKFKQQERERERVKRLLEEAKRPKEIEERIFIIVSYLQDDLLREVVTFKCPVCGKKVLPSDPKHCSKIPSKMKADRLYCGHFYHHHCLTEYLSNPPFHDTCITCGAQINHHRFSDTREQLERRWGQKQARQREIQDLSDLFGF